MAKQEVTGKTQVELEELRNESDNKQIFEGTYCLAKVQWQPDGYDGPPRYCTSTDLRGWNRCELHGGAGCGNPENLEPLAAMKHGAHATQTHLMEDFTEADRALYEWVMTAFPEAYDLNLFEDPTSHYDLRSLAVEVVRAERVSAYLIREGEIVEKDRYTDDGRLVLDKDGNVVTEKSEHYLSGMMVRQRKLIMKMEDSLGISRKARLKRDETTDATDRMEALSGSLKTLIGDADRQYNPDEFGPNSS